MKPEQRDSISNTFIVAVSLCLVCSSLVALAAVGLKPLQQKNMLLDKKKNILSAAGLLDDPSVSVEKLYADLVEDRIIDLSTGEDVTQSFLEKNGWTNPNSFDQSEEAKEAPPLPPDEDIAMIKRRETHSHVYIIKTSATDPKPRMYVFPIRGYGLWSMLKGFIALDADLTTIRGLSYYEQKETPGLGGEVDNPNWKAQWKGKMLYDDQEHVAIKLIKNADPSEKYRVDALSGATITSRGVENMLKFWMGNEGFGKYIKNIDQKRVARASTATPSGGTPVTL